MANPTKHPHGGLPGDPDGHEHDHPGDNAQVSFERRDIDIVQITGFGIGLILWASAAVTLARTTSAARQATDLQAA